MPRTQLDEGILKKISHKTRKTRKYVVEQVSKRASRQAISSEAALILWAKQLRIGTSSYQRRLAPHAQQEIQNHLPTVFSPLARIKQGADQKRSRVPRRADSTSAAIEFLLTDQELRSRCTDLIKASGNYDRVFREATTVLDDRLKNLAGLRKINPAELAIKALNPPNPILRIVSDNDEQKGFFLICQGLFSAFRNPTHHQLSNQFTRQHALKFGGFVDLILNILGQAQPPANVNDPVKVT